MKGSVKSWVIAVVFCCFAFSPTVQAQEVFRLRLTMMPIELATRDRVTGSGSGSARLEGQQLSVSGLFMDMGGPATVARVHESPVLGVRGPSISDLEVTLATKGEISGEVELTTEQVESLRKRRLYIQIHSTSAPDGNLWGWLVP